MKCNNVSTIKQGMPVQKTTNYTSESSDPLVRTDIGLLSEKTESSSSKFTILTTRQAEAYWAEVNTYEQRIHNGNFIRKQNKIHQLEG